MGFQPFYVYLLERPLLLEFDRFFAFLTLCTYTFTYWYFFENIYAAYPIPIYLVFKTENLVITHEFIAIMNKGSEYLRLIKLI